MAEYIGWLVYDKVKIVKKFNSLNQLFKTNRIIDKTNNE